MFNLTRNLNAKIDSVLKVTPSRYTNPSTLISILIIISVITNFLIAWDVNSNISSYGVTEFLINFQGGFVRRGAVGEIYYHIISATGLPVITPIYIFCALCYLATLAFFFMKFKRRNYCWWLILCPFFLGMNYFFVRKDFIIYLNFIAIVALLSSENVNLIRKTVATLLAMWTIFLHEAFIFYGGVFTILLLISNNRKSAVNWVLAFLIIASFLLNSYFKGSVENATAIRNSWNALPDVSLADTPNNSIGAIGWTTMHAIKIHLCSNFVNNWTFGGVLLLPINLFFSYYIVTTFLSLFKGNKATYGTEERNNLSALYLMGLICLIPMFTVLSCDNGRLYQYASVTAFTCFLLLSSTKIKSIIPACITNWTLKINSFIDRWFKPNKIVLTAVLLFVAQAPCGFSPSENFSLSIWGAIGRAPMVFYSFFHSLIS